MSYRKFRSVDRVLLGGGNGGDWGGVNRLEITELGERKMFSTVSAQL